MKDPRKYNDSELATQHNDVIFGRQTFSLLQKRLYLLAVAQIKREDQQLHPYRVKVKDIVQSGSSKSIYDRLDDLTDQLMRKIFKRRFKTASGKPGWEKWPMIDYAKHVKGEGIIEIDFHPRMEELLLNLQKRGNFTPVPIINQIACTSTYGQRIYAILYSWRRHGRMEIDIEHLREALDLKDKYPNFSHFRSYVLDKAQNDLQKNTNMRFTWKEEKRGQGRKITHLIFNFKFVADQLDMALQPQEKETNVTFKPKYKLMERLKNNAELNKKQVGTVLEWLSKNEDQQYPLADWLHRKVEHDPVDSLGNPIRDIQAWTWDKVQKAITGHGFPQPQKTIADIRSESSPNRPDYKTPESNGKADLPSWLKEMDERNIASG